MQHWKVAFLFPQDKAEFLSSDSYSAKIKLLDLRCLCFFNIFLLMCDKLSHKGIIAGCDIYESTRNIYFL